MSAAADKKKPAPKPAPAKVAEDGRRYKEAPVKPDPSTVAQVEV